MVYKEGTDYIGKIHQRAKWFSETVIAMGGIESPTAFMDAVDAVLVSYDYIVKHGSTLEKGDLGIQLDRLKAARRKH